MAKKKDTNIPLANDTDSDFSDDRDLLNYRPNIDFVEPEQETYQDAYKNADELKAALEIQKESEAKQEQVSGTRSGLGTGTPELEELLKNLGEREQARLKEQDELGTLDDLRDRTDKLVNGLDAVAKLSDLAQKRIDQRVSAAGGMTVKLDPVKDATTIAAMKRKFPDKADPTQITYDDYKKALDCVQQHSPDQPAITAKDLKDAKAEPNKTSFGGSDNIQGENRPEISSPANILEPINLDNFQKSAVKALFALMLPLIAAQDELSIAKHLITVPHKPI